MDEGDKRSMNTDFKIETLDIEGVKVITPFVREDRRGYFLKYYEKDVFEMLGIEGITAEDFESYSVKGVIRGLHFQTANPQIKIVHTVYGEINDVVVDLRKGSASFGRHLKVNLSAENHKVLYIPRGFAHGFEVLSDFAVMSYKCIGEYIKGADTGLIYNSPELGIAWETKHPIVSEKDKNLMSFETFRLKYEGL